MDWTMSLIGLLMMPTDWMFIRCGILLQARGASVQKKFAISFRAFYAAGFHAEHGERGCFGGGAHAGDGFLMQRGIADDAALPDFIAVELELRFDKDQKFGAGRGERRNGRKNLADGDEGDVHCDEGRLFGQVGALQVARIAFDHRDARILLKLPIELAGCDVDSENLLCAALEEAIGEAARGAADVKANE